MGHLNLVIIISNILQSLESTNTLIHYHELSHHPHPRISRLRTTRLHTQENCQTKLHQQTHLDHQASSVLNNIPPTNLHPQRSRPHPLSSQCLRTQTCPAKLSQPLSSSNREDGHGELWRSWESHKRCAFKAVSKSKAAQHGCGERWSVHEMLVHELLLWKWSGDVD